ncbi:Crp/Fnr family transcriptional regulator [Labrenzia sp. OB1]|uniref:Crp/Fnr family transcriptional regulator n=1 Tax=Labrenzia sp. OB1 TaxID=1561204 RepID=UPI0007B18441|nr:Crp/Fnr family transcriptional regulator [Labrenzia sp. OB1]KZM50436.1 Crp/Fnr family transcriptional regulator [Labrenzia sp. OB1]
MNKIDESLLAGVPPFRRLDRGQIREILDLAVAKRFDEGVSVFSEGMPAERFYLLLDGYIRAVKTTAGGEHIIAMHIAPGQLFGIAAALGRDTYPATAMTAAETLALSWPMRLWDEFTSTYDGFASETYKVVGDRLQDIQSQLTELATQAVEQRLASALLRMVNQSGRKVDNGIEIAFPVTRLNISEMTGTTLHTVSRVLSAWQKQGIVESTRRHIVVTEPHQLVLLSGISG